MYNILIYGLVSRVWLIISKLIVLHWFQFFAIYYAHFDKFYHNFITDEIVFRSIFPSEFYLNVKSYLDLPPTTINFLIFI